MKDDVISLYLDKGFPDIIGIDDETITMIKKIQKDTGAVCVYH